MATYDKIKDDVKGIVTITQDIEELRKICYLLLNIIEESASTIKKLTTEVQDLRDEVNRLKGEHGQPKFKPKLPGEDHSSEDERNPKDKPKVPKKPKAKKHLLEIMRQEICHVDPSLLPNDAVFKGYQSVIVQDIIIQADNIEFKKEVFYSPSLGKNFIGEVPAGYAGDFGPSVKALILNLHHESNMTESAIVKFMNTHGILISSATVARIILGSHEEFKDEKAAIIDAGLTVTIFQHLDDTGAKVNGKQSYTHVLCNPFYTAYFTRPDKSRITLLEILSNGNLVFRFDDVAYEIMQNMNLPEKALALLKSMQPALILDRQGLDQLLNSIYPDKDTYHTAKRIILEASAIAGYRDYRRAIPILLCDDAPQFKQITQEIALCWVHEGRHYKKLTPLSAVFQLEVKSFIGEFWGYYRALLQFKANPTADAAEKLSIGFDALFNTEVKYNALAERMKKTREHKHELLTVLRYPEIPLHNNPAELGARAQARKRDISFHTKTEIGTLAKDTIMTVVQTAKKLKVNVYNYLRDRISKSMDMRPLAEEILVQSSA
jgi:hypothetical protein